uniref:2-oxoglutarate-dependent dioxygenase htyE-like n=1 Tax=Styela clava TaxID=7725 RepID=UPI0019396B5B|nr:2-oxoglutarate-dependent dioxygenase htyE-like [Styela clava]
MGEIPIVDFWDCGLNVEEISDVNCTKTGEAIYQAFAKIGFVYLKNTGITREHVDEVDSTMEKFYKLDTSAKKIYVRDESNFGYIGINVESINPKRPGDYKEAFNISYNTDGKWPDEHVPKFSSKMETFCELCRKLSLRIIEVLTKGMKIKDSDYLMKCHSRMNGKDNFTTLRALHYPPIPDDVTLKPGQIRLGEHCDYGSFTLLFQDNVGGLQVEGYDGKFMEAVPIPDTVLVNIGDILQFWTDGRLKSTKHRVMIPGIQSARNVDRKSLAYFVHPDHEVVLSGIEYGASCLDHHERIEPEYKEPVTAFEHVNRRFQNSYIN